MSNDSNLPIFFICTHVRPKPHLKFSKDIVVIEKIIDEYKCRSFSNNIPMTGNLEISLLMLMDFYHRLYVGGSLLLPSMKSEIHHFDNKD